MEIKTVKRLLEFIESYPESEIFHMKDYMFDLITFAQMFRDKYRKTIKILDLGTGKGHSLFAFALAMDDIGVGKIYTLDMKLCEGARKLMRDYSLDRFVEFINGNSLSEETFEKIKDVEFDLIFHDLSHELKTTEQELEIYGKLLKIGGLILIHDTLSLNPEQNVNMDHSIKRFLERNKNFIFVINKEVPEKIGLGVLLKVRN